MGNATAVPHRLPRRLHSGKVILSDGTVHEYQEPLTVAELMLEYPQHMVIEFPPSMNSNDRKKRKDVRPPPPKRPAPLPADKKLEMNKVYFMVPVKRSGNSNKPTPALSVEDARRILFKAESLIMSSPSVGCSFEGILPLLMQMIGSAAGGGGDKKLQFGGGEGNHKTNYAGKGGRFGEMLGVEEEKPVAVAPAFLMMSRSVSGKGWKPSLDTITEKAVQAKLRHWLF